jgi:hypothetical protein
MNEASCNVVGFVARYDLPVFPPCSLPPILLAWGIKSKAIKLAMVGNSIQAGEARLFEID